MMKGFTLVELIATLVIGSVLAAIVIPSSIRLYQRNELSDSTNQMVRAYSLARSSAKQLGESWQVSRTGSVVSVSPVNGGCTGKPCSQIELNQATVIDSFSPAVFNFRGEVESDPLGSIQISHRSGGLDPRCISVRTLLGVVSSSDGVCS